MNTNKGDDVSNTLNVEESKTLLADAQRHQQECNAASDIYDSDDPAMRAAVEAIDESSLPSNRTGLNDPTETEDLKRLRDKLDELLAITSTKGRYRVGKNHKRTQRRIFNIKAFIDSLPTMLSDMVCYSDDAANDALDYVSDEELLDLKEELDELIAAETALRSENGAATSFVIEPLPNGDVLIRFRSDSGDGDWHSAGAQLLSRACFLALAKADPERKRIVDPVDDCCIPPYMFKRRYRVQTEIVIQATRGKTALRDGHWRPIGLFESLEASLRNGSYTEVSENPPVEITPEKRGREMTDPMESGSHYWCPPRYRVQCEIEVEINSDDDLENALKYGNWEPNSVMASIADAIQQGKYVRVENENAD